MREINYHDADLGCNVSQTIEKRWLLITAGTEEKCNTMTANWGGLGRLWHRDIATIYVRPERYTYDFIEREDYFTLSFLPEKYRDVLKKCGSNSGRDVDKVKEYGLTVQKSDKGGIYFTQADLVLVCKKCYAQDMDISLMTGLEPTDYYGGSHGGVHRMYLGEIVQALEGETVN